MQTVLARESVELGMSRAQLRGQRWRRLVQGLYVPSAVEVDLVGRCSALQRILPTGAVYAEFTAAALHGWWLPPLPDSTPICTAVPPHRQPPRRPGIRGRRVAVGPDEVCTVSGLPVTSPIRTLLDLAAVASTVDLVVVLDSALRSGHCTEEDLRAVARERIGARGIRTLRRAVVLANRRGESPWETVLRLLHVLADLPNVRPQVDLTDATGGWIARADLWLVGTQRIHEFDGGVHRDRDQHGRDLAREKRLSRCGYERYGYTAREIRTRPITVIRDAENAFGLEPDPRRLRRWLREFQPSLFSPAGQQRLVRRWRLGPGAGPALHSRTE